MFDNNAGYSGDGRKIMKKGYNKIQQIDFAIPGDEFNNDGKMKWMVLNDNLFAGYVDIYSRYIPKSIFTTFASYDVKNKIPIKINYCFRGRCEVMLDSGSTTFVIGDELAIDYGTSNDDKEAFFYPSAEYEGIEIIIYPSNDLVYDMAFLDLEDTLTGITNTFKDRETPLITISDIRIKRCMEDIKEDIINYINDKLLIADISKLLILLKEVHFEPNTRRTFCTNSQVDIAKKSIEIITKDLSQKYSAAELAAIFGISESSLKNYIRTVFGRGYKELVHETRMKKAADLIVKSEKSIGEIAESVGYQNQSRFSEAFLKYHKVLPMEYKRQQRVAKKDKNTILI